MTSSLPSRQQRYAPMDTTPFARSSAVAADILPRPSPSTGGAAPAPEDNLLSSSPSRRDRLWELSTNLHCSIIGTCLSTADLRSLLAKLGDTKARTASEHELHGQAVTRAGRKDEGGKLLHKLLDRRHEREVGRFSTATTTEEVRRLWQDAAAQGRIPGAYWAVLTHPATDRSLVQEAFGEVHMLSHLVGRSVRADLRRLSELEAETRIQADTIAEQQIRIQALTDQKVALTEALAAARNAMDEAASRADPLPVRDHGQAGLISRLKEQLGRAEAHAAAEAARREMAERTLQTMAEDARHGSEREEMLRAERDALESALSSALNGENSEPRLTLDRLTLLYVGGRPRQVSQARLFIERCGGQLLTHDGGVDETTTLLPGLVSRASAVLLPVDCVSHDAMGLVKRACHDSQIPFVPLRSASLAAMITALSEMRSPGC